MMKRILFVFIVLFFQQQLTAGVVLRDNRLKGLYDAAINPEGIATGHSVYLQDDQYDYMVANPSAWPTVFTNCQLSNRVFLRFEESARIYYSAAWSMDVACTLKKWDETGTAITPNETFTLTITYDPVAGTVYTDKDVYVSNAPGYRTQLDIGTISYSGAISAVPADVVLETEIEVSRTYTFNQTSSFSQLAHSLDPTTNTLTFSWEYMPGAESYDLEWVHVSSYDGVSVASPDLSRATRINTSLQSYTINLPYDDGYIVYRVRGVSYDCGDPGFRSEGAWTNGSSTVAVSNIDGDRNWQYNVVYAEDGKRKEVITFYDGTGKQRQAVTLNNTTNTALIGETMYDYEGRPAVQTLPAPEAGRSSVLGYYQSFSLVSSSTAQYTKKAFDKDALFSSSDCDWDVPPGMDVSQGASNYYSSSNISLFDGMYAALPNANEFPFVQTVYGSDGRPVKQSAPGIDHTIGSDHQVETYYTSPSQQKLDRMFGNEVGYAQHYNQITVKDPNGQVSVSYLDLSGRTIATALVGEAPANLTALASNQSITLTEDFNNSNIFDAATGTWTVNSFYMVNDASGDYTFTYTMTPEEYEALCTSQTFDCVYDLKINIYDACDNPIVDNETVHVLGTPYTVTHASGTFSVTFDVTFPKIGVYRIEKVLSLNQAALDAAVASFQASLPGTCFDSQSSLEGDLNGALDLSECVGCDSSCALQAEALGLTGTAKQDFIDSCRTHDCAASLPDANTCDAMLAVFAGDLTPGGQYFDGVPAGMAGTVSDSWLLANVWDDYDGSTSSLLVPWTNANFRDPAGNLITNWADMRTYWQTGWATQSFSSSVTVGSSTYNSLVEFHPEYCHYGWCVSHSDDKQFDLDLFQSDDYTWAASYPSGTGNAWTDGGGGHAEGINMIDADPYFNTSPGSSDYTAMLAQIDVYSGSSSMWDYAGTLAGCTSCNAQWVMFRTLYVSAKAQYMHAAESSSCTFLCDADVPPDFYADACSGSVTEGFMIRIPDLVTPLSTTPSSSWATNSQNLVPCNTSALAYVAFDYINGSDYSSGLYGTVEVNYTDASSVVHDITCGLVTLNGPYTMAQVATMVAAAINSCVTVPDDFTAYVDPSNPNQVVIVAPATLGDALNNQNIDVELTGSWSNTDFKFDGGVTGTGPCLTEENCFCQQLYSLEQFYNSTNPNSSYSGNYIIDHSLYTNGVDEYIASALNTGFGTSVTYADVAAWRSSCDSTLRGDPRIVGTEPAIPAALDCTQPEQPCEEDAYDITAYYAGVFYQQQVDLATQNFIQEYIQHCFGGSFSEDFNVVHPDREYHLTLYYYDQAGNLTRTVPPAGVKLLNSTQTAAVNTYRTTGSGSPVYPDHARSTNNMVTNYKYNTLNNLVESATPDGGTSTFYYDLIGRIVASQNAKQAGLSNYVYSYTFYDPQGRIYEVGQVESSTAITATVTATMSAFETWVAAGTRTQVTSTYYDTPLNTTVDGLFGGGQQYLRKRIATITIENVFDNDPDTYDHATHYSYDVHGNVNHLVQEFPELADLGQQYKHITYQYDLISGNVNQVNYNQGQGDQFFHHYFYDADNRVTNVYTSRMLLSEAGWSSGTQLWEQDAKYLYYLHGPLARAEIGDKTVQGIDYAYTIHGWIKGVNSNVIDRTKDLGKDGQASSSTAYNTRAGMHSNIAEDAFGYVLSYYWTNSGSYDKDYIPISSSAQTLYNDVTTNNATTDNLYNGNIKEMSTALLAPNGTGLPQALGLIDNHYHYDQLNRIKSSASYTGASTSSYAALSNTNEYSNTFSYDANGNIQTQYRNGNSASGLSMDDLTYYYWDETHSSTYAMNSDGTVPVDATNQLAYVDDAGTPSNYSDDLEAQSAGGNYTYDAIGQLTGDAAEEISAIDWTVYGKINTVTRSSGSTKKDLKFEYDAMGQRIVKIAKDRDAMSGTKTAEWWTYTYYVRDAQGNVMATYDRNIERPNTYVSTDEFTLKETNLFGASRLGIRDRSAENISSSTNNVFGYYDADGAIVTTGVNSSVAMARMDTLTPERVLGYKAYELTNHLGNVLVTVSDRKLVHNTGSSFDYFMADVKSATDYSAFGAPMPGRSYSSTSYRYGQNGQEKDDEIASGIYTAEFWEYDSRLGRRWNCDPQFLIDLSPYAVFIDNPIKLLDILGDIPSPAEAAAIAAHVYGDQPDDILIGGWHVSNKDFGIQKTNGLNGFKSQVYERTVNGVTEYVYAYAGTDDLEDGLEDGYQPLGLSAQYSIATTNAQSLKKSIGNGSDLTFVGHSLGGGLAAASAYVTSGTAITFNPAGVSPLTAYQNDKANINTYIMKDDPLNKAQDHTLSPMPRADGVRHTVSIHYEDGSVNDGGHSINYFLDYFNNPYYEYTQQSHYSPSPGIQTTYPGLVITQPTPPLKSIDYPNVKFGSVNSSDNAQSPPTEQSGGGYSWPGPQQ